MCLPATDLGSIFMAGGGVVTESSAMSDPAEDLVNYMEQIMASLDCSGSKVDSYGHNLNSHKGIRHLETLGIKGPCC